MNVEQNSQEFVKACGENSLSKFYLYLSRGADIEYDNGVALRISSEYGHSNIVKHLMKNEIKKTSTINESLSNACRNGHLEVVKIIMEHKKYCFASEEFRPFLEACLQNHMDIIKYLLVNEYYYHNDIKLGLQIAINNNYLSLVELLKNASID